jgi:hypothetical protein
MSPLRGRLICFIAALLAFTLLTRPTSYHVPVTASPALPQRPSRNASVSCPITKPPEHPFVPPAPYSAQLNPNSFWFGTEKLWTFLTADGTWNGLPHYTPDDPTFRQKLFFWRAGFDARSEPQPALTITGKRLDAPAPPLASDQANAGWQTRDQPFIVTGINIPTLGCWQITAHYQGQNLTFVVRVTHDPPSSQ